MLTGLSLRNFKCFESADIPLGRITVLIGPNGTGKSSVLHSLALLRQSTGLEQLNYTGPLVDMSSYQDVVYQKNTARDVDIKYSSHTSIDGYELPYAYEVTTSGGLIKLGLSFPFRNRDHELIWSIDGHRPASISSDQLRVNMEYRQAILMHVDAGPRSGGEDAEAMYNRLRNIFRLPNSDVLSWKYTPVSRGFTKPDYQLLADSMNELIGSSDSHSLASGLASTIAYDDAATNQISDWMHKVTGIRIDSKVATGVRTFVRSKSLVGGTGVTISNEGFGSNQLTYMLFQLAKTPPGGLDMIEEPELHLHPFAIARLADLLVDESMKSNKQLLMTTHSEHLLLGLLNNVAEGKLPHTDLVVLSTSLTEDGAKVERVQISEDGLAEGGLPGFFDAAIEAQRRHLDALMNRP